MLGGMVMVLCQETESGATLEVADKSRLPGARTASQLRRPHVAVYQPPQIMVVTGEYGLDTIRSLRTICPANAVWITRNGPDRPAELESGIFEVSAYSHAAPGRRQGRIDRATATDRDNERNRRQLETRGPKRLPTRPISTARFWLPKTTH
jgi:hypothetical protein